MAVTNSKRHYKNSVLSSSATACKLSFFLRRAGAFAPLHSPEVYSLLPFRLLFLLPILAQYYAFVTQRGVWSPRGHSVLVPYGRLFTISHLRGYIARYICEENTLTRLYI